MAEASSVPAMAGPREVYGRPASARVDEQGVLTVRAAAGFPDGQATLVVDPEADGRLRLFVNGVEETGEVKVRESDFVSVHAESVPPQAAFEIYTAEDGFSARLVVVYEPGLKVRVKPTEPSARILLTTVAELEPPPAISAALVLQELKRQGIRTGIVPLADLRGFLDRCCSGEMTVAEGKLPVAPVSERFEPAPELAADAAHLFAGGEIRVESGTRLGHVLAPVAGQPGVSVFGESFMAGRSGPVLKAVGAMQHDEAGHLVASESGRFFQWGEYLCLVPEQVVTPRDLDGSEGPVHVRGDLIVRGDVRNVEVIADGRVVVEGAVTDATVVAGHGMTIQGHVDRANLFAGLDEALQDEVEQGFQRWGITLNEIAATVREAARRSPLSARLQPGRIAARLVPQQYPDWESQQAWIGTMLDNPALRLSPGACEVLRELQRVTALAFLETLTSLAPLDLLVEFLEDPWEEIGEAFWALSDTEPSVVVAGHAAASLIRAAGTLTVGSSFASTLEAGDQVVVTEALVGGFTVARRSVQARQIGYHTGVETTVRVDDAEGEIRGEKVAAGSVLRVAGRTHRIEQDTVHVTMRRHGLTGPQSEETVPAEGGEQDAEVD